MTAKINDKDMIKREKQLRLMQAQAKRAARRRTVRAMIRNKK